MPTGPGIHAGAGAGAGAGGTATSSDRRARCSAAEVRAPAPASEPARAGSHREARGQPFPPATAQPSRRPAAAPVPGHPCRRQPRPGHSVARRHDGPAGREPRRWNSTGDPRAGADAAHTGTARGHADTESLAGAGRTARSGVHAAAARARAAADSPNAAKPVGVRPRAARDARARARRPAGFPRPGPRPPLTLIGIRGATDRRGPSWSPPVCPHTVISKHTIERGGHHRDPGR